MPNVSHELIPITKKGDLEQWVDARTLHQFLESDTRFNDWISRKINEFGFVEGRDFYSILSKSTGGRQAIDYTVTLDMAKELSMLERNEKGKQARQYFIAAEKQLRSLQAALLSGYEEVGQLLKHCEKRRHNDALWYAASQLRRLSGKTFGGGYQYKINALLPLGKVAMLGHRGKQAWYVREDAVQDILCIKPNQMIATAMVKLLNSGGIS